MCEARCFHQPIKVFLGLTFLTYGRSRTPCTKLHCCIAVRASVLSILWVKRLSSVSRESLEALCSTNLAPQLGNTNTVNVSWVHICMFSSASTMFRDS